MHKQHSTFTTLRWGSPLSSLAADTKPVSLKKSIQTLHTIDINGQLLACK